MIKVVLSNTDKRNEDKFDRLIDNLFNCIKGMQLKSICIEPYQELENSFVVGNPNLPDVLVGIKHD